MRALVADAGVETAAAAAAAVAGGGSPAALLELPSPADVAAVQAAVARACLAHTVVEPACGDPLLHRAAARGDVALAARLLRAGGPSAVVYVHVRNAFGATALHATASAGRVPMVRVLLDAGLRPGTADTFGLTPADAAAAAAVVGVPGAADAAAVLRAAAGGDGGGDAGRRHAAGSEDNDDDESLAAAVPRMFGAEYLHAARATAALTGQCVAKVKRVWWKPGTGDGHRGALTAMAAAGDGRLVTASADGTAKVWALLHRDELEAASGDRGRADLFGLNAHGASVGLMLTLRGHARGAAVAAVAVTVAPTDASGDGGGYLVITGGTDGALGLHRHFGAAGEVMVPGAHAAGAGSVAALVALEPRNTSGAGAQFASGGGDGHVQLWDAGAAAGVGAASGGGRGTRQWWR